MESSSLATAGSMMIKLFNGVKESIMKPESRALELLEELNQYCKDVSKKQKCITPEQRQKLKKWVKAANKLSKQEKTQEVESWIISALNILDIAIPGEN